jgi:hypothetical protein
VKLLHRLASVVRWTVHKDQAERDLNDELEAFVDMAAADGMREGKGSAEARRGAVLDLGGVEQTKGRVRSARHGAWLDEVGRGALDPGPGHRRQRRGLLDPQRRDPAAPPVSGSRAAHAYERVVSDLLGISARRMLQALADGRPAVRALCA